MKPLLALDSLPDNLSSDNTTLYIDVVPLVRSGGHISTLTYAVPKNESCTLEMYALVRIPLRGKRVFGIVTRLSAEAVPKAKELLYIYGGGMSFFTKAQEELVRILGARYGARISDAFTMCLPPLQPRTLLSLQPPKKNLTDSTQYTESVHTYTAYSALEETLQSCGVLQEKKPVCILCPDQSRIAYVCHALKNMGIDIIHTYTSTQKDTQARSVWKAVVQGDAPIVVGTRSALFLPFQEGTSMLVLDEHDHGHKQWDGYPRIFAPDLALSVSHILHGKLYRINRLPPLDAHNQKDIRYAPISRSIHIVQRHFKESLTLGAGSLNALKQYAGLRMVIVPEKGYAQRIICSRCGHIYRCEICATPLAAIGTQKKAWCRIHSKTPRDISASCTGCGSTTLAYMGTGMDRIAEHVKEHTPAGIPVLQYTKKDTGPLPEHGVLIATSGFLQNKDIERVTLCIQRSFDEDIRRIHAEATEDAVRKIYYLDAILPEKTPLIIDTLLDPSTPALAALKDPQTFLEAEYSIRKKFGDSPLRFGVRLAVRGSTAQEATATLKNALMEWKKLLPEGSDCSDPYPLTRDAHHSQWAGAYARIPAALMRSTLEGSRSKLLSQGVYIDPFPKDLYAV
jgi:primosomal protein N'